MHQNPLNTSLLPAASLALCLLSPMSAQTIHRLGGVFDAQTAPTVSFFPGLQGSFRQQLLIDARLLQSARNRSLTGLWLRRDFAKTSGDLAGGVVDYVVKVSTTTRAALAAVPRFATNAPAATQTLVFAGPVRVPDSKQPGSGANPWSASNSFQIPFTTPFTYGGNTLCIDVIGRQRVAGRPQFWSLGALEDASHGKATNFGTSCNPHGRMDTGESILAATNGLVLGGMFRPVLFGRTSCHPLLMIGATRSATGIDLTSIGATGCRQYVVPLAITPLPYSHVVKGFDNRTSGLSMQIPSDPHLVGARFYLQGAETQTGLPRSQWDNPAGLVMTDGLEIQLGSRAPALGIAVVQSSAADAKGALPTWGNTIMERAPVMRLLSR